MIGAVRPRAYFPTVRGVLLALLGLPLTPAVAADYPTKPIHL